MLRFLLVFGCGFSSVTAVFAISQVFALGQVNLGTAIILSLSSMAVSIVSLTLLPR